MTGRDAEREQLAAAIPHTKGCASHRSATAGRTRLAPCRCGHPGKGCSCFEERVAESEAAGRCICFHDSVLERLLPVVDRIANQREAAALEAAADAYESDEEQPRLNHLADHVYRPGDCLSSIWLRDRAAGLRADGTTT